MGLFTQRSDEKALGMTADTLYKTFWVHTDKALYEIVSRTEDRDVWRAKLDKQQFDDALRYAKTPRQLDVIRCRQADNYFEEGRFMQAARTYAMSSRSFEFVALRFVDADERDALRVYLSERLDQLDKGVGLMLSQICLPRPAEDFMFSFDQQDLTQRMMLATWLVEIYLSKLNTLEDIIAAESATTVVDDMKTELMLMEEDTRNFLTTYRVSFSDLTATVCWMLIVCVHRPTWIARSCTNYSRAMDESIFTFFSLAYYTIGDLSRSIGPQRRNGFRPSTLSTAKARWSSTIGSQLC